MFERFTPSARQTVITAQTEARRLAHSQIGSEHLLLALTLGTEADPARESLAESGIDHAVAEAGLLDLRGATALDAEALSTVGIDLDEVRRRVEAQFGAGSLDDPAPSRRASWLPFGNGLPFGRDAKKSLELSLREAIALRDREIGSAHLLLGLLRGPGLGLRVIESLGVSPATLRNRVIQRLRASA